MIDAALLARFHENRPNDERYLITLTLDRLCSANCQMNSCSLAAHLAWHLVARPSADTTS